MSTAEGISELPRRNLITTLFSREKDGYHSIRVVSPNKREPSSSPYHPQPPERGGHRLTRRQIIAGAGIVVTAGTIRLLEPWNWFANEPLIEPELAKFGTEIETWRLANGIKVSDLFSECQKAAGLLNGKINPRQFIPSVKLPVTLDSNAPDAALSLDLVEDPNDTRKIEVQLPDGRSYSRDWISRILATIKMTPEIKTSTIRLPILTKEASQFIDHYLYSQIYLLLVQNAGININVRNPHNVPTSDVEQTIVTAHALRMLEEELTQKPSFLREIVDAGSGLRIGGILFANWYVDQLNRRLIVAEDSPSVQGGHQYAGFLQEKGLIYQPGRGKPFLWVKGQGPQIASEEFLQLLKEFTENTGKVF